MTTLAVTLAQQVKTECKGPILDEDGFISDELDNLIDEAVAELDPQQLFKLIWTAETFDADAYSHPQGHNPRLELERIGACCIREAIKS